MKSFHIYAMAFAIIAMPTITAQAQSDGIRVTGTSAVKKNPASDNPPKEYTALGNSLYECVYQYDIMATAKSGETVPETYSTILQIGNNSAKFTDMATYCIDSLAMKPDADGNEIAELTNKRNKKEYLFTGEVYQNIPEGKTTYTDIVIPNIVEYEEDFAPFEWTLTEDTLTVCGYPCMKATMTYGGRNWEAWYTEEIASSNGPWKFAGLPGLIMKVSDDKGRHTFTAVSFRESAMPMGKLRNINIQKTSRDKFLQSKNYMEEDPMRRISTESISNITVTANKSILINGVPLIQRPNGYTPIELK
ncbi:GLPGLI family protein [uncultured Muribaculum sp.]|uniref:GLPGLI family protein n=2 Tax=uncultured Muribaculum sp. TaxID=1918613 RepID=UPI0025B75AAD|nr:GLPGLI family protein [uncultured Muribaculum sp.]